MNETINIADARSGIDQENLQEILDAAVSADHALQRGQNQYQTPSWLANACGKLVIGTGRGHCLDPQSANGNLLAPFAYQQHYGVDIDNRFKASVDGFVQHRITGNCVRVFAVADELGLDMTFNIIAANPPFGIRWRLPGGGSIDSTDWTWKLIKKRLALNGSGFLITTPKAIENLKIHEDPWVYLYQKLPPGGVWDNCNVELGIVHFANWENNGTRFDMVWPTVPSENEMVGKLLPVIPTMGYDRRSWSNPLSAWGLMRVVYEEEKGKQPEHNIYLDKEGMLRTYLSTRNRQKMKHDDISRLHRIHNCHPLTLTTERETRKLMMEVVNCGIYTISDEALAAIKSALQEVASLACPIMPPSDFALIAHEDENETAMCKALPQDSYLALTVGKRYEITTGSYPFVEKYQRKKLYYDEDEDTTEVVEHDCELHGTDRYIQITDDRRTIHRFMDRPEPAQSRWQHKEEMYWQLFHKPHVPDVADVHPELYAANKVKMEMAEMIGGYTYFPGQRDYYARMGCKDYGLVAAGTGTGKTLGALTLQLIKSPRRTLIIAPQGTMRSSGDEDGVDYQASQWVQEIQRFAPTEPVFQLFSEEDYERILHANGNQLPNGIFITYPQAYFSNGAFEHLPDGWSEATAEEKFCKRTGLPFKKPEDVKPGEQAEPETQYHIGVGSANKHGIRCVVKPSLATIIATKHGEWDMVLIDEAHLCFPYSTEVVTRELGAVPIGEIVERKLDVHVLSCNIGSDVTQWKRITGHFSNAADRPLVRVVHDSGSFICTDDHRVRVGNGWKRAKALLPGEKLRIVRHSIPRSKERHGDSAILLKEMRFDVEQQQQSENRQAHEGASVCATRMQAVQTAVCFSMAVKEAGGDAYVLQQGMRAHGASRRSKMEGACAESIQAVLGEQGRRKESGIVVANDPSEPNASPGSCGENAEEFSRSNFSVQRRQRETHPTTDAALRCIGRGMADGIRHTDAESAWPLRVIASPLQGRLSESVVEPCDRGGRSHTPDEEVEISGPPQRERPEISRVVRVEVLQQRGGIPTADGRGADNVYCIEVEDNHNFFADGVLVANCCNLDANITQNVIRLQPKYRFAFTATPIPNIVSNIFSLMGWLCVPNWYKGKIRNAAWPYSVEELHRFESTFLSIEIDKTAQNKAYAKGKKNWRSVGTKSSPIISAPARLLKLLGPTMAYISKESCNPNQQPRQVIDVRVKLGKEQAKLYAYWLERKNYAIPDENGKVTTNPLIVAMKQLSYLRGVCAAPASLTYTKDMCKSNFNPKTVTILQLIRDIIGRGEQVVVVSARVGQSAELSRRLSDAGIPIARIDSTVTPALHAAEANRFKKGDAKVMLMGIKCAQAHSFDRCSNLIVGSLEWSYGALHQAEGRVWRLTSPRPVKVWCVLHERTIEELLFDRVAVKQDAATMCLHGKRVPRDFKTMDAAEILAEHVVSFDEKGDTLSETECEIQWPALRKQLVRANINVMETINERVA